MVYVLIIIALYTKGTISQVFNNNNNNYNYYVTKTTTIITTTITTGQPFRTNKFEKIKGPHAPGQKGLNNNNYYYYYKVRKFQFVHLLYLDEHQQ